MCVVFFLSKNELGAISSYIIGHYSHHQQMFLPNQIASARNLMVFFFFQFHVSKRTNPFTFRNESKQLLPSIKNKIIKLETTCYIGGKGKENENLHNVKKNAGESTQNESRRSSQSEIQYHALPADPVL